MESLVIISYNIVGTLSADLSKLFKAFNKVQKERLVFSKICAWHHKGVLITASEQKYYLNLRFRILKKVRDSGARDEIVKNQK